jgi:hypothetical protein
MRRPSPTYCPKFDHVRRGFRDVWILALGGGGMGMPIAEIPNAGGGQAVVIGMKVGGDEAEGHRDVACLLQPTAGADARGVAIGQNPHFIGWRIGVPRRHVSEAPTTHPSWTGPVSPKSRSDRPA